MHQNLCLRNNNLTIFKIHDILGQYFEFSHLKKINLACHEFQKIIKKIVAKNNKKAP